MIRRLLIGALLAGVALLLVIQLVPYGRNHTNPPVTKEVQWNNQRTKELVTRTCYDCHSNQTTWPWYSNVAPMSWLTQHDVEEGRQKLNFSEWDKPQPNADRAADDVKNGRMPRAYYIPLHPSANLSQAEKDDLIQGLIASLTKK